MSKLMTDYTNRVSMQELFMDAHLEAPQNGKDIYNPRKHYASGPQMMAQKVKIRLEDWRVLFYNCPVLAVIAYRYRLNGDKVPATKIVAYDGIQIIVSDMGWVIGRAEYPSEGGLPHNKSLPEMVECFKKGTHWKVVE